MSAIPNIFPPPTDSVMEAPRSLPLHLLQTAAIVSIAIGFAMHYGMQVGISNHCQYLLHGIRAADPTFLVNDWFTTKTPEHHWMFGMLVAALSRAGILNVTLGLMNAAASAAFSITLYFIIARLTKKTLAPFAATMALLAYLPTSAPGHTHILLPYFVPSVFAGTALLVVVCLLLYGHTRTAGIMVFVCSASHINYLMLLGPLLCIYIALSPKQERKRLASWFLGPWIFSWIPYISFLITVASHPAPADQTHHIFWDVYNPLHYRPATWKLWQWYDYFLILAAGFIGIWPSRRDIPPVARRIVLSFLILLTTGAIAIICFNSDIATTLFPWRFAPFLTIAAYIGIGLCAGRDWTSWWNAAVVPAFIVAMVVLKDLTPEGEVTRVNSRALILLGAVYFLNLIATFVDRRLMPRFRDSQHIQKGLVQQVAFIAALFVLAALGVRSGLWRQDMFTNRDRATVASLYKWCREETPPGTIFAIPPDLFRFRLATGRAIIIDFKCFPLTPSDQIEWYRRHERQAGVPVAGYSDAIRKYAAIDEQRALDLRREFGIEYLVMDRKRHKVDLSGFPTVFQNDEYTVKRVSKDAHSMADPPRNSMLRSAILAPRQRQAHATVTATAPPSIILKPAIPDFEFQTNARKGTGPDGDCCHDCL